MYNRLPSLRRRALRLSTLAVVGVTLIAACDTDQPVAPKPAAIPTAARPALGPAKSGTMVIKLLDEHQNPFTQPSSGFQITGPTGTTWWAKDNKLTDTDSTTGVLVLEGLVPGVYKVCELEPPIGFGVVGSSCQPTEIFAGATSGLVFVNAPDAFLGWEVRDDAWNTVGGTTFAFDSNSVIIGHIADNAPADHDPAPGKFGMQIPFESKYQACLIQVPAGYVLQANQSGCASKDVKMHTGTSLGTFFVVPMYSANWTVTDGVTAIGPSTFKVLSGAISITVVDNGPNDYHPTLGRLAVKLPAAGYYSVCEIMPPANHWNAKPSCKRISVAAAMPASAGIFVNPEKQVYSPAARTVSDEL